MTPVEILVDLINKRFGKSQAAFARAIKRSPSQVNQWLSGYRKLDDKGCRHIERALDLPADYMIGNPTSRTLAAKEERAAHHANPQIQAVVNLAEQINDDGLQQLITYATFLAGTHPAVKAKRA